MPGGTYTLADLCDLADVTPRTIRYYVARGLLRSPGTSGPGARYDDGHLARLRLIRRLQREHLPLAEIRARLAALTDEEAILQSGAPAGPPAGSALEYVRGVLGGSVGRLDVPAAPPPTVRPQAAPAIHGAADVQAAAGEAPGLAVPPDRSHWERFTLAPDVELHVRRPLTRSQNRAVARLLEVARELLEEDLP